MDEQALPDCRQRYCVYLERKSEEINEQLAECRQKKASIEAEICGLGEQLELVQNSLVVVKFEMSEEMKVSVKAGKR